MAHSRWPKRPQHKVKGVWANENALASAGTGWSPRVVHFSTATHMKSWCPMSRELRRARAFKLNIRDVLRLSLCSV